MLDKNQQEIVDSNEPRIIVEAGAGSGKALPNSTLIPTTNGIKKVSDIKIGDFLYDKNGNPTKVLGVYPQGKKEVYKITFGDSREALCSNEHIWYVHKRTWGDKNKFKEYTVNEMLKEKIIGNNRAAQFYIPTSKAIEKETIDYKIPPYIIGAFLANGCCMNHSRLTLSTENEDIPKLICSFIPNLKYKEGYNKYKWQFFFDEPYLQNFLKTKKFFKEFEKEICQYSYNKKIPEIYKNGSIKQRLELLQGLLDGDGSISKIGGTICYTSTSLQLIKDIREVLWSLGYNSKLFEEKRTELYTNKCYYILINIPNCEKHKLFLLKRKKDIALKYKNIKQKKDFDRISIRSIEKMNYKEDMTCFYVDNKEHLFLMNDYIVTHNTRVLIERIKKLLIDGVPPENIVAISFTNMAAEEMKERLVDVPGIGDCFIGTIHSFANKIFKNSNIEYKLFNEEIQDQFMNVLIALYGKFLTMPVYLKYKEYAKKVDMGLMEEEDIERFIDPNALYEIKVFLKNYRDKNYPENMSILCKRHNVITFDELLERTTKYFKEIDGKVEYLFVDEFQDIGPLEKKFFQALNADNYFYVGDEKQALYAFKGGNVNFFLNLIKSPKWKTYYLKNNYRCGQAILELATRVIVQADDVISYESICKSGKVGNTIVDSKYKIDNYLKSITNYKDWFVLVRTNKDLVKLEAKMREFEIPYVSFRKGEMTLDQMRNCMAEDKVKLLTIHTSKGLESPNVLLWGNFPIRQKPYLRNNDELKVLYVGITRGIDQTIVLN